MTPTNDSYNPESEPKSPEVIDGRRRVEEELEPATDLLQQVAARLDDGEATEAQVTEVTDQGGDLPRRG